MKKKTSLDIAMSMIEQDAILRIFEIRSKELREILGKMPKDYKDDLVRPLTKKRFFKALAIAADRKAVRTYMCPGVTL